MSKNEYDIAILGCGPAGLSAAVNVTIRNKKAIIIGSDICSPPLNKAPRIDNYLGFHEIPGKDLIAEFIKHTLAMGVKIRPQKAEVINQVDGKFAILSQGEVLTSQALIIATGIPYKSTLKQEDKYTGKGLGYCATCDAPLYRGQDVLIIGHNTDAEHEANYIVEICNKVYYLPLYKVTKYLDSEIEIISSRPERIVGDNEIEGLMLKNGDIIDIAGLFILGAETAPDRLVPGLEIDDNHIKVNRRMETNIPGVYAAGDCTGHPYQIAKSVGEGQIAGLNASKRISMMTKNTGK